MRLRQAAVGDELFWEDDRLEDAIAYCLSEN